MRYVLILLTVFLTACGTAALPTIKPYKLGVQQGNVVTSKMLLQLRPGMTKSQVRFIMGTPLIQDSFHGNRWDYVYQMREAGKLTEQRRVILDFDNELLKAVRGDVIASTGEQAKADAAAPNIGTRVIEPPAKAEEKSLLGKLKFWEKDEAELAKDATEFKAKAAAAEAAKNVAPVENSAPATASILAVPLEVQPALDSTAPATLAAPEDVVPAAASSEPVVMAAPVLESPVVVPVDSVAVPAVAPTEIAVPTQENVPEYESTSGMRFDRTLKFAVENSEPVASSKALAPRVGNTAIPTPKALPADAEPSMFDRMLEKIGF